MSQVAWLLAEHICTAHYIEVILPTAMGVLKIVRECDGLFWRFSGLRRRRHYAFPLLSRERAEDVDVGKDIEIGVVIH